MFCPRCSTHMIASQHREVETIGDVEGIKLVSMRECPACSVIIVVVVPLLQTEKENH